MDKKKPVFNKNIEIIEGSYHPIKDWVMDPKGYFLVRFNKQKQLLELGHCIQDNVIEFMITGKTPQEVYFTACEKGLISRLDHAAYLGKELEKAYLAMKYGLEYVQDEELEIK
ncbi:MAG: DUF4346 domain-containing protein [Nanoarchaeota archaeon]